MATISGPIHRKEINFDIESLRGYAALFVVWHHAITYRALLDPGFCPSGILAYTPSGHFYVLIFFILSGYVIGLSNKQPLSWSTGWTYLKKRLVRVISNLPYRAPGSSPTGQ